MKTEPGVSGGVMEQLHAAPEVVSDDDYDEDDNDDNDDYDDDDNDDNDDDDDDDDNCQDDLGRLE